MRKLSTSVSSPKYGLRPQEVAAAFGSPVLLELAVKAGMLKPTIRRHKLTIYDAGDVAQCWAKIVAGGLPHSMQREIAST